MQRIGRTMAHSTSAPASEELLSATVEVLADTLGLRDGETRDHCTRVVELAARLGRRLGLSDEELRDLAYAARVHDIGKVGVPDAILYKPGPLDELEAELLHEHSGWGAELVDRIPGLEHVAEIVRHHHERFDGRGYPDGLEAEESPAREPHPRRGRRLRGDERGPALPARAVAAGRGRASCGRAARASSTRSVVDALVAESPEAGV